MNDGSKPVLVTGALGQSGKAVARCCSPGDMVAAPDLRNSVHTSVVVAVGNGAISTRSARAG